MALQQKLKSKTNGPNGRSKKEKNHHLRARKGNEAAVLIAQNIGPGKKREDAAPAK